jgi:hypothetical protein
MKIKLQPSPVVDNICDGHEMTKLPYPYFVELDGTVGQQDIWQGDPVRAIGFQRDLAVQQIDLWWRDAARDPQQAVGMYLVSESAEGVWGVHTVAITDISVIE